LGNESSREIKTDPANRDHVKKASRENCFDDLGEIQRPENWQVTMAEEQGQFVSIAPKQALQPRVFFMVYSSTALLRLRLGA
jgi:hypothetical protein